MKNDDLKIGSIDQKYINRIAKKYDIDYGKAKIYKNHWLIANQIIYYILTEAVNNLYISDDNKNYLISKIYCNCVDSGYDISSEDVDDMIDGSNYEKQMIKNFLSL